jgi:hypothetical protein
VTSNHRQRAEHEPLFDVHPLTGISIEVFYSDRTLKTFGRIGAGWFWWSRQRAVRQRVRQPARSPREAFQPIFTLMPEVLPWCRRRLNPDYFGAAAPNSLGKSISEGRKSAVPIRRGD